MEVFVQEAGCHEHIENPDFIEKSSGFRWTKLATDTIVTGIKTGATPKFILRNMRDKNFSLILRNQHLFNYTTKFLI